MKLADASRSRASQARRPLPRAICAGVSGVQHPLRTMSDESGKAVRRAQLGAFAARPLADKAVDNRQNRQLPPARRRPLRHLRLLGGAADARLYLAREFRRAPGARGCVTAERTSRSPPPREAAPAALGWGRLCNRREGAGEEAGGCVRFQV